MAALKLMTLAREKARKELQEETQNMLNHRGAWPSKEHSVRGLFALLLPRQLRMPPSLPRFQSVCMVQLCARMDIVAVASSAAEPVAALAYAAALHVLWPDTP